MSATSPRAIRILLIGDEVLRQEAVTHLKDEEAGEPAVTGASQCSETGELAHDFGSDVIVLVLDSKYGNDREAIRQVLDTLPEGPILCVVPDAGLPASPLMEAGARAIIPHSAPSHELIAGIRTVVTGGSYQRLPGGSGSQQDATWWGDIPTSRELQVLQLVGEGHSNRAIAERLSISRRTVQFHLSRIFVKLGATSRTHAVHLARQRGLIQ